MNRKKVVHPRRGSTNNDHGGDRARAVQQPAGEAKKRPFEFFPDDEFDMRLILVGRSGSGKSSVGNTILQMDYFPTGSGFSACTGKCYVEMAKYRGQKVRVVDTCGLFDTSHPTEDMKTEAAKACTMIAPGPHVFLLVIPVGQYTPEHQDTVGILEDMFPDFFKYTIVVFTRGDELKGKHIEDVIKEADPALRKLVRDVQRRFVLFDNLGPDREKKEKTVLDLLDMVYNVYQLNGESYFHSDQFLNAESVAKHCDEEIRKETKKPTGPATGQSTNPEREMIQALLSRVEEMERRHLEQTQQLQALQRRVSLTGTTQDHEFLVRYLTIKEVQQDMRNEEIKNIDPFSLKLLAKRFRKKSKNEMETEESIIRATEEKETNVKKPVFSVVHGREDMN